MLAILASVVLNGAIHTLILHVGDTWKSTLETTYIDSDNTTAKSDLVEFRFKVTGLDGGTWTVEAERKFIKTTIVGVEVPPPADTKPEIMTFKATPTSCLAFPAASPENPDFRLSRYFQFTFPPPDPEIEARWTQTAARASKTPQMDFQFELRSVAMQDTWDATATELNGATATGFVEIKSNGLPDRVEWLIKHKPIPDEEDPMDIKLVYKLVEFKPAVRSTSAKA